MAESCVASALVNERAEIAGMIARTEQQLGQFRTELVHLDATLRLFAPDLEPKTIPAKKKFGKPISGSSKENCRGACSTRFARAGELIRAPDLVRAVMSTKVSTLVIPPVSPAFSGKSETH